MKMNMHKWNSNVSEIGDNNVVSVLGIKSVINNCRSCRRFKVKSLEQPFAPLVEDRVKSLSLRPFESTGIDFAGPFYLTHQRMKCYILIFTCMQIRAVHIEITNSLEKSEFLKAFYRF